MHFTSLLASAVLATSALAAPHSTLAQRVAARGRRTVPPQMVEHAHGMTSGNSSVSYSQNWAGAVIQTPPAGSTFSRVAASFVVPTPKAPAGASAGTQYAASAWVGIDGDTYAKAILQTGVDFTVENGEVSYDCWYEWYPNTAFDFTGIPIKAGDTISVSVTASSSSAGVAKIENVSTGKTVTKSLTAPSSSSALGGKNAEWIVEDFEQGSSLVPFADFGSVTFTSATYTTSTGATGGPGAASIFDIKQNKQVLTSASVTENSVVVNYK